jgi:hypothetical protein
MHLNPVKSMQFAPMSHHLAICTGQNRIFIWSPKGASICELPKTSDLMMSFPGLSGLNNSAIANTNIFSS